MATTIKFYGFTETNVTGGATHTASPYYVSSASALGYSTNNDTFANVKRLATARGIHVFENTDQDSVRSSSLCALSVGTFSGIVVNTSYSYVFYNQDASTATYPGSGTDGFDSGGYDTDKPNVNWLLQMRFDHTLNTVGATDIQIWDSSSDASTTPFTFAKGYFCEVTASGYQAWRRAHPNGKLDLTNQTLPSYRHNFYVGYSLVPSSDAVGFCNWGRIRTTITYS